MIEGVKLKELKVIPDERGWLFEILRCDEDIFEHFGQVYLTTCYPDVVKAWHYHKLQADNLICIKGMIKLALYDGRETSPTFKEVNEFFLGEKRPALLKVPPNIYHGFKAVGGETAYIINIPTHPYNHSSPDEFRLPPDTGEIPYNWILDPSKRHG